MSGMDSNLLHEAVKTLVGAVRDFLNADDGCDDDRIVAMKSEGVHDVLTEARKTPALHDWAVEATATDELWNWKSAPLARAAPFFLEEAKS